MFQAHLAQYVCNRITDRRSRCKRQINDTKRYIKPLRCFLGNKLTDTGYLERGLLDRLTQYFKSLAFCLGNGTLYNTRSGYADVYNGISFGHSVEGPCHERIVVGCVTEYHKLGTSYVRPFGCFLYYLSHKPYGIHIYTASRAAHIDR